MRLMLLYLKMIIRGLIYLKFFSSSFTNDSAVVDQLNGKLVNVRMIPLSSIIVVHVGVYIAWQKFMSSPKKDDPMDFNTIEIFHSAFASANFNLKVDKADNI